MNYEALNTALYLTIVILGFIIMAFSVLYGIVIARYYDPLFPKFVNSKESFESGWWIFNPLLRGARYGGLILFPKAQKRPYNRYFFGDFDFRVHARKIDWIILIGALGCFIIAGILSIVIFILNGFHFPTS